jgi:hypothetical protein
MATADVTRKQFVLWLLRGIRAMDGRTPDQLATEQLGYFNSHHQLVEFPASVSLP